MVAPSTHGDLQKAPRAHLQPDHTDFYTTKNLFDLIKSQINQLKINLNFCLISLVLNTIDAFVNGVNPASNISTIVERGASGAVLQIYLKYWSVL